MNHDISIMIIFNHVLSLHTHESQSQGTTRMVQAEENALKNMLIDLIEFNHAPIPPASPLA